MADRRDKMIRGFMAKRPKKYGPGDDVTPGAKRKGTGGYHQTPDQADRTRTRIRRKLGFDR